MWCKNGHVFPRNMGERKLCSPPCGNLCRYPPPPRVSLRQRSPYQQAFKLKVNRSAKAASRQILGQNRHCMLGGRQTVLAGRHPRLSRWESRRPHMPLNSRLESSKEEEIHTVELESSARNARFRSRISDIVLPAWCFIL